MENKNVNCTNPSNDTYCNQENSVSEVSNTSAKHQDLKRIDEMMPPDELLYDLADLFKIFGDTTRIKILYALSEAEMCVGDIAELLGLTQTAVSHQLRVLKSNKLVKFRKEGKMVYYSLSDDHVTGIINMGMDHVEE